MELAKITTRGQITIPVERPIRGRGNMLTCGDVLFDPYSANCYN